MGGGGVYGCGGVAGGGWSFILSMRERIKTVLANVLGFSRRNEPDVARLRAVTAAQIPLAAPGEVEISEVRCGNETVFWRARCRGRCYHCHSGGSFCDVTVTRVG